LRADRHILASRHRERAGDEPGNARYQNLTAIRVRGSDAHDEACCREDAIVGTENGSSEPADTVGSMSFAMSHDEVLDSTSPAGFTGASSLARRD
jgi:hypothetical protein